MNFTDYPADYRMAVRQIIENNGGMVSGYYDGHLQVALPSDAELCSKMAAELRDIGMEGEQRITWFPLGSDNPPESLRHYGNGTAACPRGDRPSYWKLRTFFVMPDAASIMADHLEFMKTTGAKLKLTCVKDCPCGCG